MELQPAFIFRSRSNDVSRFQNSLNSSLNMSIRKAVGANYISSQCEFSLWAPFAREAWLEMPGPDQSRFPLNPGEYGYWSLSLQNVKPGTRYFFNIDQTGPRPDPASKYQPDGVHGPSCRDQS